MSRLWEWFIEHVLPDFKVVVDTIKDIYLKILGTDKLRTKG